MRLNVEDFGELHPVGARDRGTTAFCQAGLSHRRQHLGLRRANRLARLIHIFLIRLGEGRAWCLELFQCTGLGHLGLTVLHPQPCGWLAVEGFRLRVDDGLVLLNPDSSQVRYAPVRALAFNDAAQCGPSSWYT